MMDATRSIYTTEGPRALYKGLLPTLIQIVPYSGLQFGLYTFLVNIGEQMVSLPSDSQIGKSDVWDREGKDLISFSS